MCPSRAYVGGKGKIQAWRLCHGRAANEAEEFVQFLIDTLGLHAQHSISAQSISSAWIGVISVHCCRRAEVVYSEVKNLCVWAKTNGGMGSLYRSQHELVFVFQSGSGPLINNVKLGAYGRNRSNVWDLRRSKRP